MCRFLGFDSYNSYILSKNNEPTGHVFPDMLQLVYKTALQPEKDLNYHFVCRGLSHYCYKSPGLMDAIPDEILNTVPFQRYFIGRFPLLDLMDHGFGKILEHYKKYSGDDAVKLFVHTSIYLHRYKSGKTEKKWLRALESIPPKNLHPFLVGRYYGLQLHQNTDANQREKLLKSIQKELAHASDYKRLCMLFTFLDFAISADMFAESLTLLTRYNPNPSKIKNWVEYGYFEVFKIYRLLCLARTGKFEEAEKLKEEISIEAVAFYFRKTYRLMYLEAAIILEKKPVQKQFLKEEFNQLKRFLFPLV